MKEINIEGKMIGMGHPTYFIADLAANHDGDLERAKKLIYLSSEAGANAAKFQHFTAKGIVSDAGFKTLGGSQSHQAKWDKTVFEVYQDASINQDWTSILKETCAKAGITFLTSPYSLELVDKVDPFVSAFKIGSGDVTWLDIIDYIASKHKPVLLATGASTQEEVDIAMAKLYQQTDDIVLMQCNTNYTASLENFHYINLNVLKEYGRRFPNVILGLSDHTPGHATVLGAVTLGARVIEKHFTDDTTRVGPDHKFSMDFESWKCMVDRTRELENSLGVELKKVEQNEKETVVLQRRAIRAKHHLPVGSIIHLKDLEFLRPCPTGALAPYEVERIIDKVVVKEICYGELLTWKNIR